jgi:ribulose 1,5-bisphosphate synthetase/thiazole synthase
MLLLVLGIFIVFLVLYYHIWRESDPSKIPLHEYETRSKEEIQNESDSWNEVPHGKKFCVIGAGFCGLGIASALKRHKIPFDVIEASSNIGGNWCHGVYQNVNIISSRITTEYKVIFFRYYK